MTACLQPAERQRLNYDEPAAIDIALLTEQLRQLAAGGAVLKPRYSFETHTRVGVEQVAATRLIVVEGLFTARIAFLVDHLGLRTPRGTLQPSRIESNSLIQGENLPTSAVRQAPGLE